MRINTEELKILVIEKENIDVYLDFISLTNGQNKYTKEELINILNNEGQVFMFKYKNVTVSSCVLLKPNKEDIEKIGLSRKYDKVIEYGNQDIFVDFKENEINKYMIKRLDRISKNLGYKYAVVIPNKNEDLLKTLQEEKFKTVDIKDSKDNIRIIYYKKL